MDDAQILFPFWVIQQMKKMWLRLLHPPMRRLGAASFSLDIQSTSIEDQPKTVLRSMRVSSIIFY